MIDFTLQIFCPWCDHKYSEENSLELAESRSDAVCEMCTRRFRILAKEQIVRVETDKYCWYGECKWKPTLAKDFEKCSCCYDVRKIPVPVTK